MSQKLEQTPYKRPTVKHHFNQISLKESTLYSVLLRQKLKTHHPFEIIFKLEIKKIRNKENHSVTI